MPVLTLSDVIALVESGEPESITLDYKGDFTNDLERAKKELAKDVAAFANSQGGMMLLGVEEDPTTHAPRAPLNGLPTHVNGRQKIGDWLGQVLNQNIAQRVAFTPFIHDLPDHPGRCIIVLDIPISPRAPHMVTYQQDNRYYRRFFRRHQFESLPAEEYEVREMFQRSLRFTDEVRGLLQERGYADADPERFALNLHTQTLRDYDAVQEPDWPFVSYVAVPTVLRPDAIDLPARALESWLNTAHSHPLLGIWHRPPQSRYTFDGRLFSEPDAPGGWWREFLFIGRNGYVEYGTVHFSGKDREHRPYFCLTPIVGRYTAFLAFVRDLYRQAGITGNIRVLCNLTRTRQSYLRSFGQPWQDREFAPLDESQYALDDNIQVVRDFSDLAFNETQSETLMRWLDLRIESAYNHTGPPRSFHHPHNSPGGDTFAVEQYRRFNRG